MRRTCRCVALVAAVGLSLAACSGAGEDTATGPSATPTAETTATAIPTPTPTPSPTPDPGPPRPLNGLPVQDEDQLDRRVIAVKIDNHREARPQSGIDEADVIYELPVESGLTRFIALFHTADPDVVGPMRSGRPTDPALVLPSGNVLTISGAQPWVLSRIRNAGVELIGEVGPPQTFRVPDRRAPHDLYVDVGALRELADERGYVDAAPSELFAFAEWDEDRGAVADDVLLSWSSSTTVTWRAEGGAYTRLQDGDPHLVRTGQGELSPVEADTLVVIEATRYTARPPGPGTPVPALDTVGSGVVHVFHDGRVVEGRWSRDEATRAFSLTDLDGRELVVPPGRLWVSILPSGRRLSW